MDVWRILCSEDLHNFYTMYQIMLELSDQENEMSSACSTLQEEQECVQNFGYKTLREETTQNTQAKMTG